MAACGVVGLVISLVLTRRGAAVESDDEAAEGALANIMKRDVYTLMPTDTVETALALFSEKSIFGCPIVEGGAPRGFPLRTATSCAFSRTRRPPSKAPTPSWWRRETADFGDVADRVLALPVGRSRIASSAWISAMIWAMCVVCSPSATFKKVPVLEGGRMVGVVNRSNITGYAVNHYLKPSDTADLYCERT